MSERDAEDLLRETMRERAAEFGAEDAAGLLPAARQWGRVRARLTVAAVALGVLGVTASVAALANRGAPSQEPSKDPAAVVAPTGWVVRGSRGLEVVVPADWVLNDYACNQTDAGSFVNSPNGDLCLTPEPPTKQVAVILTSPDFDAARLAGRSVDIAGVSAFRAEGRLADGRYAGLLSIPSRNTYLSVRTLAAADRDAILDSARLVAVDHLGCEARRPVASAFGASPTTLIEPDPRRIVVCFYGPDSYLVGSAELLPAEVDTVVAELRAAAPGRNPAPPASMCLPDPSPPDVVLIVEGTRLWVTFSGCGERGVDNGVHQVHVTRAMIAAFMAPLKASYGYTGDLP